MEKGLGIKLPCPKVVSELLKIISTYFKTKSFKKSIFRSQEL